ncbi:hypothetical Protein YC6258_05345 [Gynuella sunshinyii YC6258]|uniref:Uncharacterized protein n=1 Tax=Gynuella sunshinyii YC6258 TaxID=1445510 RepID=A0A0C5VDG4_9GAMM|nr:hypothetical Protein YC6258_05345 [Gynuella sunshinyii YC6258]
MHGPVISFFKRIEHKFHKDNMNTLRRQGWSGLQGCQFMHIFSRF